MKKYREGFTLIELLISLIIFSFISFSMVSIYVTANRHFFQNYRYDKLRIGLTASMKFVENTFKTATVIDSPSVGGSSKILAFASNVDPSGCNPITGTMIQWHYFCIDKCYPDSANPNGTSCLYYHTNLVNANGDGCPGSNAWNNGSSFYPISCTSTRNSSETMVVLLPFIISPDFDTTSANDPYNDAISNNIPIFSRNLSEPNIVRVRFRVYWRPYGGLKNVSREVDSKLETYLTANMVCQ